MFPRARFFQFLTSLSPCGTNRQLTGLKINTLVVYRIVRIPNFQTKYTCYQERLLLPIKKMASCSVDNAQFRDKKRQSSTEAGTLSLSGLNLYQTAAHRGEWLDLVPTEGRGKELVEYRTTVREFAGSNPERTSTQSL